MGIDLAACGTEVYSFAPGTVRSMVDNDRPQDYGPTIITVHEFKGQTLYALYGHLSRSSLHHLSVGDVFSAGAQIGWIGEKHVGNGGWNPHLHFQLLPRVEPIDYDLRRGCELCSARMERCKPFPDPRLVVGQLYD